MTGSFGDPKTTNPQPSDHGFDAKDDDAFDSTACVGLGQTGFTDLDRLSGAVDALAIGQGLGIESKHGVAVVVAVPQVWLADNAKQFALNGRRQFLLGIMTQRVTIRCVWDSGLVAEWLRRFLPGVLSGVRVRLEDAEHIAREVMVDWSAPAMGGRS